MDSHYYACQVLVLISLSHLFSLQEIIKDQVAKMYLWPKALEVQIMDPTKYV